jgi:hypothetical protein
MSMLMFFAWLVAVYFAGGVLTTLAAAFIGWSESRRGATARSVDRGHLSWTLLKVFAFWPVYVLIGAVFATLNLGQKRPSGISPTFSERVTWAVQVAMVVAVSCLAAPFYLVLALGWRLRGLWGSRNGGDGAES